MKYTICIVAVMFMVWPATAQTNSPGLTVEQVVAEVLKNNRMLKSARSSWEAMKERVPQERAWADPRTGVDVERTGTTRFDTFTDNEWMISQEIPISGKNRLRGKVAEAEANAFYSTVRGRELDLASRARVAFFRYANTFALIDLNHRNEDLLKQFAELSREKYRLGLRSQADALMAETELAKNGEALRDLELQLSESQSRLNVLMNRPANAELLKPTLQTPPYPEQDLPQLVAMAFRHRPELQNGQFKIKAAETRRDLAKRQWIPDPELRVEARQYNGSGRPISEYDTGIFFNIPWVNYRKYKAAEREAQKNRESAVEELAALELETFGMVRDQLKRIENTHHHFTLFQEKIVPLARQTVEATLAAYRSDKATLLDLISAQRGVREGETMLQQHWTDYMAAVAEMQTLVGPGPGHK
jgi:outer membrane protein, heavy metal efflux system